MRAVVLLRSLAFASLLSLWGPIDAGATAIEVSIGIRETGTAGPIGADGGTSGGIEFVNRDGQTLTADGTWQVFTFTPSTDPLLAFAGTTANSLLDTLTGTLEMIRLKSTGFAGPWAIYIDDVVNTTSQGSTQLTGFEGFALGTEVMFQEPGFSGSTAAFLLAGSTAGVSDEQAYSGSQSYKIEFEFVDDNVTNWVRLTTFDNGQLLGNPAMVFDEAGIPSSPTISFALLAVPLGQVPEPGSIALLCVGLAGLRFARRGRPVA